MGHPFANLAWITVEHTCHNAFFQETDAGFVLRRAETAEDGDGAEQADCKIFFDAAGI